MQLYVADVAHAREVHHHALEAEAEARVAAGAVAAQVAVPPVVGGIHAKLHDAALEHIETLLALAAADDLADAGHKAVRRGDSFAVVVQAHIERLDLLGIIGDEHGALEDLLGEKALVLGLEVGAPVDLVVEPVVVLFEQLDGVGVGDAAEVAGGDVSGKGSATFPNSFRNTSILGASAPFSEISASMSDKSAFVSCIYGQPVSITPL